MRQQPFGAREILQDLFARGRGYGTRTLVSCWPAVLQRSTGLPKRTSMGTGSARESDWFPEPEKAPTPDLDVGSVKHKRRHSNSALYLPTVYGRNMRPVQHYRISITYS